ncbi:MAG TPA: glycoside hydrolase family 2 TIM barrel-domain containing protein [Galbitalea sp.]|jgi:beta-galactosidase/beta-glucuronidase|nr:glycoside hydrolase family 2 TIM barrel-domain containing protein [Galbitalea sp.]
MSSVRPEYPRPHFDRSHSWLSLNGEWEFRADPDGREEAAHLAALPEWDDRIVVPFAWETQSSWIGAQWLAWGWYRRVIAVPSDWQNQRIVLHFGAVHHAATVWVGGTEVGEHVGGYTPFELDITDALAGSTTATVLVRVWAPIDKRYIAHGKQRSIPRDDYDNCSFTPSSGIWQSVWLEARPATFVSSVSLVPTDDLGGIEARIEVVGSRANEVQLRVTVDGEAPVETSVSGSPVTMTLPVREPRLWSPRDPHLYNVKIQATSADGTDTVTAYTGLRSIRVAENTLVLNGERLYVRGVLDQGYWPRSGITAPTDDAFVTDIELARAAGFTVIRKHLKLEDPRFLHHADRLGMLVWAEPASTGRYSVEAADRFEQQIEPMVRRDGNHPSIVIWGLYNEEWGLDWDVAGDSEKQAAVRRAFDLLKSLDRVRPTVDNSGWSHVSTDIVDWHIYDDTPAGWASKVRGLIEDREDSFPVGIGPGIVVDKPLVAVDPRSSDDKPNLNSEFGGGFTSVERGWNQRWQTLELRRHDRLSGYVWTELYDIEHEMAGLYDADRQLKDSGGNVPAYTNADTVLIPNVVALSPGKDFVAASDGSVTFEVRVSHHGTAPVNGALVSVWSAPLAEIDISTALTTRAVSAGHASADPYRIGGAVQVAAQLPEGSSAGRLHVALVVDGSVIAVTAVDVVRP